MGQASCCLERDQACDAPLADMRPGARGSTTAVRGRPAALRSEFPKPRTAPPQYEKAVAYSGRTDPPAAPVACAWPPPTLEKLEK
eukprot:CAMPEP_0171097988 /NCGR_PEP_ID=MMETSP0766_2-20121228/47869_1 /TAXON_ID=439317 /ORGANISM="Gambierdiscus australes, Strain CAWD 149" /LENGTH=84 /DNA_ID=CAMNT_0011557275 /DNA_START=26 /DNA_END=280 /DNA_ORIENTATION=-